MSHSLPRQINDKPLEISGLSCESLVSLLQNLETDQVGKGSMCGFVVRTVLIPPHTIGMGGGTT